MSIPQEPITHSYTFPSTMTQQSCARLCAATSLRVKYPCSATPSLSWDTLSSAFSTAVEDGIWVNWAPKDFSSCLLLSTWLSSLAVLLEIKCSDYNQFIQAEELTRAETPVKPIRAGRKGLGFCAVDNRRRPLIWPGRVDLQILWLHLSSPLIIVHSVQNGKLASSNQNRCNNNYWSFRPGYRTNIVPF